MGGEGRVGKSRTMSHRESVSVAREAHARVGDTAAEALLLCLAVGGLARRGALRLGGVSRGGLDRRLALANAAHAERGAEVAEDFVLVGVDARLELRNLRKPRAWAERASESGK